MLESIGMPELLVILVVAVLLFGGSKIPELAKGLGQGIRNFKDSMKDESASLPPAPPASPPLAPGLECGLVWLENPAFRIGPSGRDIRRSNWPLPR